MKRSVHESSVHQPVSRLLDTWWATLNLAYGIARRLRDLSTVVNLVLVLAFPLQPLFAAETHSDFDVVIAGGSTAAFAAAVSAAESGARVALLEPTDWIGGQITSSGVPAIDEAWHKLSDASGNIVMDVAKIARSPSNISPHLRDMLDATACPGKCWVSRYCFEPREFLERHLLPLERQLENLTVFRETVLKRATTKGRRIDTLTVVQRTPISGASHPGYDRLPSQDLADWYREDDSPRFKKRVIRFVGDQLVFIDATEWGELLVLTDAPYLLGVEHHDGALNGDDTYGQSITFGFVQELHADPNPTRDANVPSPACKHLGFGDYSDRPNAWDLVWTYRRLRAEGQEPSPGDLSLQNWGYYVDRTEGGNDYPFGYLFLSKQAAAEQARNDWRGGVDLRVMAAAEQRAFAWHHWFKSQASGDVTADHISLNRSALGASHGLSKLPYIRDTRRSIGIDNFLLKVRDLELNSTANNLEGKLAKKFDDRIALGAYPVDIHPMANRNYPDYVNKKYDIAPFTIPFRALTNDRFENLLVAGKTMAQSFLANSATRLHPTEWSTGTAAGVAAAQMADKEIGSRSLLDHIAKLQTLVKAKTPIDWNLD